MKKDHLIKVNQFYLAYVEKDIGTLEHLLLHRPRQRKARSMLRDLYKGRAKLIARITELEMLV